MLSYARAVVTHRRLVLLLTLAITVFLGLQLRGLQVIVDADELLPRSHPFVEVTERVQALFGNRYTVVVALTAETGTIWTPERLAKVAAVTEALAATPGVTPGTVQSLAAPRAKDIAASGDGLTVRPLLATIPATAAEAQAIAARLAANPAWADILVSRDGRTAAIYAQFEKDANGFAPVMAKVKAAVDPVRSPDIRIAVSGQPVFLAAFETYSKRMAWLLPIAIVVIGLIHLEAFRTVQGLLLPLVTAVLAVVWSVGLMAMFGIHLDPFNNVTPILILAVAAGHAVQVLKRYYEEYGRLRAEGVDDPREASRQAVVQSLVRVGPVMLAAGSVAALSFLSLVSFDIQSIRTFGIMSGLGIVCVLAVELSFTPALRAMLPPPTAREARAERHQPMWDRLAAGMAAAVSSSAGRRTIFVGWAVGLLVLAAAAATLSVDNSLRGFIGSSQQERVDDRAVNAALAGSNTFYVLVEGQSPDAIKDLAVLRGMEATQAFLEREPEVGHSLSIVDMLKQIHGAMAGGDRRLPDDQALVSQYLLLYSLSGEPGDFDGLVDYPYQRAIIQAFVKTDSSAYVADLDRRIRPVIEASFPPGVSVRLGGSITTPTAMNAVMVEGKLRNMAQVAAVLFVVASLLFRSWQLGGLILVPLGATALGVLGTMGLAGIPLQIATATVSALAIGIGADYAIYLAWRMREELARQPDEAAAIRATYASAGKAVLFVATAVAGGYAVLMASPGFNVHLWLGMLIALAMLIAAASTLTLFAALLLVVRPRVIFGQPRTVTGSLPQAAALLLIGCVLVPARPAAAEPDAATLMAESHEATRVQRSVASGRFILQNRAGQQRVRETQSFSEAPPGAETRRLVRFDAPADIAGTTLLTVDRTKGEDDIWVYLPALRKVRRLVASDRRDSFVGTDFTYGDVVGHDVGEWDHRFVGRDTLDGVAVLIVESRPASAAVAAATGYGRRVSHLRASDRVLVKCDYFDTAGRALKTYNASDIRQVDPKQRRFQPMQQVMRNAQTGHSTTILYTSFRTDVPIAASRFSPRSLDRPS